MSASSAAGVAAARNPLEGCSVFIPLKPDFRFQHEPTRVDEDGRFIGRLSEIESLAVRIERSEGGAILVTGYRGVGKTSFINQVIRRLRLRFQPSDHVQGPLGAPATRLVDISMSLPRSIRPIELMHHIVRRLYERLDELDILQQLDEGLRERLGFAYRRTSENITRKTADGAEINLGGDLTSKTAAGMVKLPLSLRASRSRNLDASAAPYDERSAEHDIVQLAQRLALGFVVQKKSWGGRFRRGTATATPKRVPLKIVLVFDELDKLELADDLPDGTDAKRIIPSIELILRSLKTLLTTSRITFIFVAGKELYDRWLKDVGAGDSIYESIFAHDLYLPCIWSQAKPIVNPHVDLSPLIKEICGLCRIHFDAGDYRCRSCGKYLQDNAKAREAYDSFLQYVSFLGRGIPRRIWREFNNSVSWFEGMPILAFTDEQCRMHLVYAELWSLLTSSEAELSPPELLDFGRTATDGCRLIVFYLSDWILRRGARVFSDSELSDWCNIVCARILPAYRPLDSLPARLLKVLVRGGFVEEVRKQGNAAVHVAVEGDQVRVEQVESSTSSEYRLLARRVKDLMGNTVVLPEDLGIARELGSAKRFGDYSVLSTLGSGGMAKVYRAVPSSGGKPVALKVLDPTAVDAQLIERFRREAKILQQTSHPNIVQFIAFGDHGGHLFTAMELIDGLELEAILQAEGPLRSAEVVSITNSVSAALLHLHSRTFVRNDVKPSNVMISNTGRVCVIDLGTTRKKVEKELNLTKAGFVIGTPLYMPPEQIRGALPDERGDIYSLGAVMYKMLTGRNPFDDTLGIEALFHSILTQAPEPPGLHKTDVSPGLADLAMKCLSKSPSSRPQTMAAFRAELEALHLQGASSKDLALLVRKTSRDRVEVEAKASALTAAEFIEPQPSIARPPDISPFLATDPFAPPPPAPKPPAPSSPGVFTSMFAAPPPVKAPPVPAELPGDPGEFTKMFGPRAIPKRRSPAGEFTMMFAMTAGEVTVISGPALLEKVFRLWGSRISIGRDLGNQVVLDDDSVSRHHAEILWDSSGYWIEDLGSKNGVRVNATPASAQHPLKDGDVIVIGAFSLRFHVRTPEPQMRGPM